MSRYISLFGFVFSFIFCCNTVSASGVDDITSEELARVFTSTSTIGVIFATPLNNVTDYVSSLGDIGTLTDDNVYVFNSGILQTMLNFCTDNSFGSSSTYTVIGNGTYANYVSSMFDAGFTISSELSEIISDNPDTYCMYGNHGANSVISFAPLTSNFVLETRGTPIVYSAYYMPDERDIDFIKNWKRYTFVPSFTEPDYSSHVNNPFSDNGFIMYSDSDSYVVGHKIVCFSDETKFNEFWSGILFGTNFTYNVYPALVSFPRYVSYETLTETNFATFAVQSVQHFNSLLADIPHDDNFTSAYNSLLREFSGKICVAFECLREPLTVDNVFNQENVDKLIPDSSGEPEQPPSDTTASDLQALAELISYGVAWLICLGSIGVLSLVTLIIYNTLYKHIL